MNRSSFLFICVISMLSPYLALAQGISRPTIYGDSIDDQLGNTVSLNADGTILAIGMELNDSMGTDAGKVKVYNWNGRGWVMQGNPLFGAAAGDKFGGSLQLDHGGNTLVVGSPYSGTGKVNVFEWDGRNWNSKGSAITAGLTYERFGFSTAISANGNVIAVGSPRADLAGPDRGIVSIYSWSGTFWNNIGALIGESAYDEYGFSLALSENGKRIIIGAPYNDGYLNSCGHAQILEYDGISWNQLGSDIDGESSTNYSGTAVTMDGSGNTVAIGAPQNNNGNGVSGHVRVYKWNGTIWAQSGSDIDGAAVNDFFGSSLAMNSNGSILAVGAKLNDGSAVNAGHARIYRFQGNNWTQMGPDIQGDTAHDQFSIAIDLDSLGFTFSGSAPYNDNAFTNGGQVKTLEIGTLVNIPTEEQSQIFSILPNPFQETFNIRLKSKGSGIIYLLDMSGKKVLSQNYSNQSHIELEPNLPVGIYQLIIQDEAGIPSQQLLIKR